MSGGLLPAIEGWGICRLEEVGEAGILLPGL
jgi:hypothetical protein